MRPKGAFEMIFISGRGKTLEANRDVGREQLRPDFPQAPFACRIKRFPCCGSLHLPLVPGDDDDKVGAASARIIAFKGRRRISELPAADVPHVLDLLLASSSSFFFFQRLRCRRKYTRPLGIHSSSKSFPYLENMQNIPGAYVERRENC